MMKFILTLLLLVGSAVFVFAQSGQGNKNMEVKMTREAYYPQGDPALYTYIFNQLKYSEEAKAAKVSGDVMVSFWVEKDSTLSDIKTLSDPGYGVGENLKGVLKTIKYVPALVNGVVMRSKVIITVPVRAH
jgi:protein TonB